MDRLREALSGQYKAGLEMLRQCIVACPDELWAAGDHPRTTWRIAYHAVFYTHLYLSPSLDEFEPWELHQDQATILWDDDERGTPPDEVTFSQAQVAAYVDFLSARVDGMLAAIELDSPESGFYWYKIPKLDHQILNVRHLGVHVGQLQELLLAKGIEPVWVSKQ